MKNLMIAMLFITSLPAHGQNETAGFDGSKWEAPYFLAAPAGWDVERFPIPIAFAPQIPYHGVEDIRFTPGWAKSKSDDYWTYAFLWYLDSMPEINERIIESNLRAYYTGLISSNAEQKKIPAEKIIPVKVSIQKIKKGDGDLETWSGTIKMLDYMQQLPVTLNCIIHVRSCPGRSNGFVFHEISPKPFTDNTWKQLDQLWVDFKCDKNH